MLATFEIGVVWSILNGGVGPREPSPDPALRRTMSEDRLRTQPSNSSLSTSSSDESTKTDYVAQEKHQQQPPPDMPQMARVGMKEKPSSKSKEPQPTKSSLSLSAGVNSLAHRRSSSPITSPVNSQASAPRQCTPPSTKKLSTIKLRSLKPLSSARVPSPPTLKSQLQLLVYKPFILASHDLASDAKFVQLSAKRLVLPVEGGLAREAVDSLRPAARHIEEWSGSLKAHAEDEGSADAPDPTGLNARAASLSSPPNSSSPTTRLRPLPHPDTVSAWIGLPEDEYRRSWFEGFGKTDEGAAIVGKAVLKNKRMGVLSWVKEPLERSVREEEEDSSSDEEDEEGGKIQA
ncbi:hypothetical protein M407DRAFT_27806 [Tulasnella calospora MUT 4182]|uniref:Uncharacterized protein n=1 Tax=Tulasnella calospora MUT 4182 TaxID=1051891 RepID=A0A0C3KMV2_9AGAM|nr:hypothetical protein M407DRAFT_27806 [Tulasnella calospora MUT 4182]